MKKLNKIALLLAVSLTALLVAGCDDQVIQKETRMTYCIDGVLYYSMHYRLAPAFNTDSTVKLCN